MIALGIVEPSHALEPLGDERPERPAIVAANHQRRTFLDHSRHVLKLLACSRSSQFARIAFAAAVRRADGRDRSTMYHGTRRWLCRGMAVMESDRDTPIDGSIGMRF